MNRLTMFFLVLLLGFNTPMSTGIGTIQQADTRYGLQSPVQLAEMTSAILNLKPMAVEMSLGSKLDFIRQLLGRWRREFGIPRVGLPALDVFKTASGLSALVYAK